MRAIYLSRFFFAFLSSYSSFSVSFSDSFTFSPFPPYLLFPQKFISSRATRENLSFSLSLSLLVSFRVGEGREHRYRVFEGDDDDDGFAGLSLLLRCQEHHR